MILKKPLKTTQNIVIEECRIVTDPLLYPRLLLTGCEKACQNIEKYQKTNPQWTCDCNSFLSNLGIDSTFYYNLLHFKQDKLLFSEVGLAELDILEGTQYINRLYCLFSRSGEETFPNPYFFDTPVNEADEYLHIVHYNISNPLQLFIEENTIPYTSKDGPSVISMNQNTVLCRGNEDMCAMPLDNFFSLESFSKNVVKSLKDFKNQLTLKTSKLYTKFLATNKMSFTPTEKPANPDAGDVIFDISDNTLKYYNGTEWVNI